MEKFPNLMREKVTQIQETQRVPSKRNPKRPIARHIIIKVAKFQEKERILKATREKQEVTYKGAPIRLATDFSMETLQARREWQKIFQVMRTRPSTKTTLPSKALNQDRRPNKELPRQKKSKRIQLHQNSSVRDVKVSALRRGRKTVREKRTRVQRE